MADYLKTFQPKEKILASDTNSNNEFLLNKISEVAGNLTSSLETQIQNNKTELEQSIAELAEDKAEKDLSNVESLSASFKALSMSLMRVNYSGRISAGNTFTAPSDGLVTYSGEYPNSSNAWVKVNGVNVVHIGDSATGGTYNAVMLPLTKGDVVTNGFGTGYFFPLKGVN